MSSKGSTRRADSLQTERRDGQRKPASSRPQHNFNRLQGMRKSFLRWLHVGRM